MRKERSKTGEQKPLHVLIVEDNEINAEILKGMLTRLGVESEVVHSGEDAITRTSEGSFPLIFMDIQMSGLDGLLSGKIIKQSSHEPPFIVALTAYSMPGDREIALDAGMDAYLTKPLRFVVLQNFLAEWMNSHKAA